MICASTGRIPSILSREYVDDVTPMSEGLTQSTSSPSEHIPVAETSFHGRYAETDQMGIVHHAAYIVGFSTHICLDRDGNPVRIPDEWRKSWRGLTAARR
jgi:hypothetical protein